MGADYLEAAKVYKLSPREMEVLEQALKGYSAPRIAENLFMSSAGDKGGGIHQIAQAGNAHAFSLSG